MKRIFLAQPGISFRNILWISCLQMIFLACQPASSQESNAKPSPDRPTIPPQELAGQETKSAQAANSQTPIPLFDGKTLEGWEATNFGGEGQSYVKDGNLVVGAGYPISGVTSTREDLPTNNYEISLDAKKTEGVDFFCGLTFPVNDSHCTFIVGGWAGVVVGLSCIDDKDASDNDTRTLMKFEKDRWYKIKVKVEPKRIQCWIDDQRVVDQDIEGHKISLRNETLPSRPLGICNFETTSHFKNIQLTKFGPTDQPKKTIETDKQDSAGEQSDKSTADKHPASSNRSFELVD